MLTYHHIKCIDFGPNVLQLIDVGFTFQSTPKKVIVRLLHYLGSEIMSSKQLTNYCSSRKNTPNKMFVMIFRKLFKNFLLLRWDNFVCVRIHLIWNEFYSKLLWCKTIASCSNNQLMRDQSWIWSPVKVLVNNLCSFNSTIF